jgi:biopolymer transport protein ExbD
MGGAASGKGGISDASLNVVPFIDLLICLICFLIISAAWTSLSKIDVDQALPKASKTPPKEPPKKKPKINIAVTPTGHLVNLFNSEEHVALANPKRILINGEYKVCCGKSVEGICQGRMESYKKYDMDELKKILGDYMRKGKLGDKIKIMVAAEDKVQYIHLIHTLDSVLHSCEDEAKGEEKPKSCLKNPSVGDINLLRAEGFTSFD